MGSFGEGRRKHTRRAGVRVPSTSKRQMVFLTGRSANGGYTLTAAAMIAKLDGGRGRLVVTIILTVLTPNALFGRRRTTAGSQETFMVELDPGIGEFKRKPGTPWRTWVSLTGHVGFASSKMPSMLEIYIRYLSKSTVGLQLCFEIVLISSSTTHTVNHCCVQNLQVHPSSR